MEDFRQPHFSLKKWGFYFQLLAGRMVRLTHRVPREDMLWSARRRWRSGHYAIKGINIKPGTEEGQAMRTKSRSAKALPLIMAIIIAVLFVPGVMKAGNLEPLAGPGPTMKTLDEIPPTWSQKLPAAQRFAIVLDGEAVLDKETGLVWEKSPKVRLPPWDQYLYDWTQASGSCTTSYVGGRMGWRLPTIQELASLNDPSVPSPGPALPQGHPFINVQSDKYWSATTNAYDTTLAWTVNFYYGGYFAALTSSKSTLLNVWCVRGGQGGGDPQ
jgi:hypothetical protein